MEFICQFCKKDYYPEYDDYDIVNCQVCDVGYTIINNNIIAIKYYLQDCVYISLAIHYDINETIIEIGSEDLFDIENIEYINVPETWTNIQPQDALALAKRLHKLILFS